jgi:hypothetical protein
MVCYRGADKSLARPTSQCILFDGDNTSFDASLVIYINSTNIPPIMIINKIYEHKNLLSLWLVSFLVGLRTYQHLCIYVPTNGWGRLSPALSLMKWHDTPKHRSLSTKLNGVMSKETKL